MNNTSQHQDSTDIKDALHHYPRLHASPDFNRRVFDAIENAPRTPHLIDATLAALCDNLDRIFENHFLKLAATALLGMAISWGCCQLVFQSPHNASSYLHVMSSKVEATFNSGQSSILKGETGKF